jgi:hypothetical protein
MSAMWAYLGLVIILVIVRVIALGALGETVAAGQGR